MILTKHYEKKNSAGVARGGADMVEMRKIDAFIQNDDYVTVTDMGEIIEVQYLSHKNTSAPIKKISKDQYVDLQTGEIKDFAHSENRGQNLDSLRKTFKKLGYLVNNNFSGKKNELWTTLTYADNVQDLKKVSADFDKFIKRLKYFMANEYGEVREIAYKKKGKNKKYKLNVKNKSKFEFVKVLEPQGRGAWHIHMLLKFPHLKSVYIPNETFADLWSHGFVDVKRIDKTDNLGAYLCAYLTDILVEDDESKYEDILRQQGSEGIETTKTDESKAVIKGGRLHMYPSGMNIFSKSKGIVYPERRPMKYKHVRETLGFKDENLTLRKSIQIKDEEHDFENTVIIEQYNKRVADKRGLLASITRYRLLLLETKSGVLRDALEQELFALEHKFELQERAKEESLKNRTA